MDGVFFSSGPSRRKGDVTVMVNNVSWHPIENCMYIIDPTSAPDLYQGMIDGRLPG